MFDNYNPWLRMEYCKVIKRCDVGYTDGLSELEYYTHQKFCIPQMKPLFREAYMKRGSDV